jgi:hypothetical protein
MHAVLSAIRDGKLLDVMACLAQADMCDWIEERGLLFGEVFLVIINMGEKAIFCKSRVDLAGSDPLIAVSHVERGTMEDEAPRWAQGLPTWEIPFWMVKIGEK